MKVQFSSSRGGDAAENSVNKVGRLINGIATIF